MKKKYEYNSETYKKWRTYVFRRDGFQCQLCGTKGTVNAHHIKRKADYPDLAHKADNGITLCTKCHTIVTNYEPVFEPLFKRMVMNKLTIDFVYAFFSTIAQIYPELVKGFKDSNRWLKIPGQLIKYISNETRKTKRTKDR